MQTKSKPWKGMNCLQVILYHPKQIFTYFLISKYKTATNVKFTISSIQQRIPRLSKKQENATHIEEKNISVETGPGITQMIQWIKKDTEWVISIFYMFKKVEEWRSMLNAQIEDRKRHRMSIYNVQNENILDEIDTRLDTGKENISQVEDIGTGTIQNERQKKKGRMNRWQRVSELENKFQGVSCVLTGVPIQGEGWGEEKICDNIIFSSLCKQCIFIIYHSHFPDKKNALRRLMTQIREDGQESCSFIFRRVIVSFTMESAFWSHIQIGNLEITQ